MSIEPTTDTGIPSTDDRWKSEMFALHSREMAEILEERQITEALGTYIKREAPNRRRNNVLDLCCGTGRLLSSLGSWATTVVGLDYSRPFLLTAAQKLDRLQNVVLVQGDARSISNMFLPGQFDVIVRAYTSLGYFTREVEKDILSQCALVSRTGAHALLDSFNADWFRRNGSIARATDLPSFSFNEFYEWEEQNRKVSCLWKYRYFSGRTIEIPFTLEGYDTDDVRDLFVSAGWTAPNFLDDLTSCNPVDSAKDRERIVALATRA